MSFLNWIKPEDYSFNSFLLLERFQIALMFEHCGWRNRDKVVWKDNMGIALKANPAVKWYFENSCSEYAPAIAELVNNASADVDAMRIRDAETYILASVEDFIAYTTPEIMDEKCDFIYGWNKERLFELVDLGGKVVLDIGAGSGRLAFAAAQKAAWVYASEPVGTLREYMRDKVKSESIKNVRVLDGIITELPFPDDTFDIVMCGHVLGDDLDAEIAEVSRVCRGGGYLIDCPGDSKVHIKPRPELLERGWEEVYYVGSFGKDVYCYLRQVEK